MSKKLAEILPVNNGDKTNEDKKLKYEILSNDTLKKLKFFKEPSYQDLVEVKVPKCCVIL